MKTGEGTRLMLSAAADLFWISLCTYVILAVAETIDPGWVSLFFNLDILMAIVLASGAATLLFNPASYEEPSRPHGGTAFRMWALCLGALGWVLTWRTTRGLGALSLFISLGSAAAIVIVSSMTAGDGGGNEVN